MNDLVNIVRCHAGLCSGSGNVEDFSGQSADLAHARDGLPIERLNVVLSDKWISRDAVLRPFWMRY